MIATKAPSQQGDINNASMTVYIAHLLIVDKDQARQTALAAQLEGLGYAVQTTTQSQRVLLLRAFNPFDLLILHIDAAAENDFFLLKRLQLDSELNRLPIILLGSAFDVARIAMGMPFGVTDYLLLPNESVLIDTRIKANLEKKRFREQAAWYLREFNEMEKLADDLRLKILPLGIALSVEKDFDRLLEQIVKEAMAICNADAGTLYLRTEDEHLRYVIVCIESLGLSYGGKGNEPVPYGTIPIYDKTGAPNHKNVATHVAIEGATINIADIYNESAFDFSETQLFDRQNHYHSTSCLTVPLKNHEVIGILQLINARDESDQIIPFDVYHLLVAESLASQATVVLHNHILSQRHEELLGFQREMEIARQLQAGFLPTTLPQYDGWDIAASLKPAQTVSGDFYDAFTMPDGKIGFVIADVCDKGVAAALFMALVRSLIRAFITQHHYYLRAQRVLATAVSSHIRPFVTADNVALLNAVTLTNDYIGRYHEGSHMFATLFFGILDPITGGLDYINAGHNPPWIFNETGFKCHLLPTGPAIGLRMGVHYHANSAQLDSGDMLLAYTDGVTEARNGNREMFSPQRLLSLIEGFSGSASALLDKINTAVHAYIGGIGQFDDVTLLAIKRQH